MWSGVELWVKFKRDYLQVVAVPLITRKSRLETKDLVSCLGTWVAVVPVTKT